ncbi:xanthine phosphoribosyltransferase [Burkholderiales bacterium]|nr:MAG: phosphoribosyltransferase [Burkholderiales bacterium]CAG0982551.1 xanthine phosphoribosyltransferase [Burkholderiales bacterium]
MSDLHVNWEQYYRLIERLATQIHRSGWRFDQVLCIARGGLRVGDVLSRIFERPLAILATRSYVAEGGTVRGALAISEQITANTPQLGGRILLVDDMVDSGATLTAVVNELPARIPALTEMRSAVIWQKACSTFVPDYRVEYLADNPWIHQPFERYDRIGFEELAGD